MYEFVLFLCYFFLNTACAVLNITTSTNATTKAANKISPIITITARTINKSRIVCILTVHFFLPLFQFCGDRAECAAKHDCTCNNDHCFHSFYTLSTACKPSICRVNVKRGSVYHNKVARLTIENFSHDKQVIRRREKYTVFHFGKHRYIKRTAPLDHFSANLRL